MAYVRRNEHEQIIAVFRDAGDDGLEFIENDDPELLAFLDEQDDDVVVDVDGPPQMPQMPHASGGADHPRRRHDDVIEEPHRSLGDTDLRLVRALEDVIELLDRKGVISESELPEPVQQLLAKRRNMRVMLRELRSSGALDDF